VGLFLALVVALQLGVETLGAEDVEQALAGMAGDAEEAAGELGDLFGGGGAFAFFGAELHAGDQAAEILVAFAGFGEQRVGIAVGAGDLGAGVGAQSRLFHGHVEARRAVDAVAVDNGHGGHVKSRAGAGEFLGYSGAFEEGESGAGVEVGVHSCQLSALSCQL
jgi:hypothetical protein